jgi:hypothetical protein
MSSPQGAQRNTGKFPVNLCDPCGYRLVFNYLRTTPPATKVFKNFLASVGISRNLFTAN